MLALFKVWEQDILLVLQLELLEVNLEGTGNTVVFKLDMNEIFVDEEMVL